MRYVRTRDCVMYDRMRWLRADMHIDVDAHTNVKRKIADSANLVSFGSNDDHSWFSYFCAMRMTEVLAYVFVCSFHRCNSFASRNQLRVHLLFRPIFLCLKMRMNVVWSSVMRSVVSSMRTTSFLHIATQCRSHIFHSQIYDSMQKPSSFYFYLNILHIEMWTNGV